MPEFKLINKHFSLNEHNYSNFYKYLEIILFSVAGFFIPLLIGHPQIVVGALVNFFLISSALKIKDYRILPVVIAPSLGALSRGLLFGPFTIFLIYLIPFIWVGNYLLVFTFRKLKLQKKLNYWATLAIGITLKAGFLFSAAFLLFKIGLIPIIFLTAMGIIQVITAVIGGTAAFGYEKINRILLKGKLIN